MKVTFYPRGSVYQVRMSDRSTCIRFSSGFNIRDKVNLEKERDHILNLYKSLHDLKRVRDVYVSKDTSVIDDSFDIANLFAKYVNMMSTGEILTRKSKGFSKSSIRLYDYVSNKINDFGERLDLMRCHIDSGEPQKSKSDKQARFNRFFNSFNNFLIRQSISPTSRADIFNISGIMLNYWSDNLFIVLPKIPRIDRGDKPILVYDPKFVKAFIKDEHNVYSRLTDELKTTWEVCATIMITTMRIGDAVTLNHQHIRLSDDAAFLIKKNIKTGVFTEMPLPGVLTKIYKQNLSSVGRLYTLDPTTKMIYDNIKCLFKMYDESHQLVTVSRLTNNGEEVIETKPMYEWTHPHMLRKTAITTMIYDRVPERFIKFSSGHSENSHAFGRYVGHVEKNYKSSMVDYFKSNYDN